jgi:lipoprotein-anchoring transpeptidase ErfK/SrfK
MLLTGVFSWIQEGVLMRKKCGAIRKMTAMFLVLAAAAGLISMRAMAKQGDEKYQQIAQQIAQATGTETVKTIRWGAKTTASVSVTSTTTGSKVNLPAGTSVTVVQRDYHREQGISQCMLKDGTGCYIPNRYLYFTEPIATGAQGDYDRATKEAYVNGQTITSTTDTLVWICLDKQRVYVFKGRNRNWKLVKTCKASTGRADAPTLDQTFKKKYVVQKKNLTVNGLQFYTFFYGSGIHKWPGSGMKESIGKTPLSASCVRVNEKSAKWIYDNVNVPLKSRVWIW